MIITIDKRGGFRPKLLPCGCQLFGNVRAYGMDGQQIEGLTGLNSKTGWLRVQRWVIDESYVLKPLVVGPSGEILQRRAVKMGGVDPINVTAPFELRCRVHGTLAGA